MLSENNVSEVPRSTRFLLNRLGNFLFRPRGCSSDELLPFKAHAVHVVRTFRSFRQKKNDQSGNFEQEESVSNG